MAGPDDLQPDAERPTAPGPLQGVAWLFALIVSTVSGAPCIASLKAALVVAPAFGETSGRDGAYVDVIILGVSGLAALVTLVWVSSTVTLVFLTRRWRRPALWVIAVVLPALSLAFGWWWATLPP
jgi:hypothetical protein